MGIVQSAALNDLIITFIRENFIAARSLKEIRADQSLLDSGIIDSTGILELIMFLEEKFDITIEDDELTPENLDTVKNLVSLLSRKGINHNI
ncbi:MAG TPA: acyl carrier protein [Spirochaetota bacterium]|nr:acyl carrier protein [Spirochaetota bacterium]